MERNRYSQFNRYRPYNNNNPNAVRNPNRSNYRGQNYQQNRPGYSQNIHHNRQAQNYGAYFERTFDNSGNEFFEQPDNYSSYSESYSEYNEQNYQEQQEEYVSPLEHKANALIETVFGQKGVRSKLIFLETEEDKPLQTLQSTVDCCEALLEMDQNTEGEYILQINKEEIARGKFQNKQIAKNSLGEVALSTLKKDCFYIIKKKAYEDVTTNKTNSNQQQPGTSFQGSKAHQMMLKMGWGGKGLGLNEQGSSKTVADAMNQNVTRRGLGNMPNQDIFNEINKILEEFAQSPKIAVLRFAPDFSLEERAHIHKMAQKVGLKSKSEGKGKNRRITITKKLPRKMLVQSLLLSGLENVLYQLVIPSNFVHLWIN